MSRPIKKPPVAKPNKHELRTAATRDKLLSAAVQLFTEQGFEKTQLEQVAARAGHTRGAIYAHYASKEDLFLALLREKIDRTFVQLCTVLENEADTARRLEIFRQWILHKIADPDWVCLTLEFKLYALRRPRAQAKLRNMYSALFRSNDAAFAKLLFAERLTRANALKARRRLAMLGAVLSGIVIESKFRPELLPSKALRRVLDDLMEILLQI